MRSKKDKKQDRLFEGLKAGLEDVIAYKKCKFSLASEEIEIPEPPQDLEDVKALISIGNTR